MGSMIFHNDKHQKRRIDEEQKLREKRDLERQQSGDLHPDVDNRHTRRKNKRKEK